MKFHVLNEKPTWIQNLPNIIY